MLVLSRKKNEGIVFDGPGRVVVVSIHADKVRLGFQADLSVTVHRDEVARAIHLRRRMAAGVPLHQIEDDFDHKENQEEKSL